jgi:hypothetical protein
MVPDIESLRSKPNLAALDADEKRQISEAAQLQISEQTGAKSKKPEPN